MLTLRSYLAGNWTAPGGSRTTLLNPATEEPLAEVGTPATDFRAALEYARGRGGPALRALTFAQRGAVLRTLSRLLHQHRDELIAIAMKNGGNTRGDAKFDIDGASATLAAYADLGEGLGSEKILVEGDGLQLGRGARFWGVHAWTPRTGVAVHINAFNFPAWGFAEKAATALLAGMPVITKPASATALVAHRIFELAVESKAVPEGALSLICGSTGDLLSHLGAQDVLAFTGSSATAATLRALPNLIAHSVRTNVEADSLNAAVLGPDSGRGTPSWNMFVADVAKEMTQKTGQKCTAIRRVLVPAEHEESVREELSERLSRIKTGNPELDEVTMGPVSSAAQRDDVVAGMARLAAEAECVWGNHGKVEPLGVAAGKGFFVGPSVYRAKEAMSAKAVHEHEVFGPVITLLVYDGTAQQAVELVGRGGGGLVTSIYSDEKDFLGECALGMAAGHGRLLLASAKLEGQTTPPGLVLPGLVHGGPGRAGGGEELGGVRGLGFYMQRTAIQGDRSLLPGLLKGARLNLV